MTRKAVGLKESPTAENAETATQQATDTHSVPCLPLHGRCG
jgi:hypothetical protein